MKRKKKGMKNRTDAATAAAAGLLLAPVVTGPDWINIEEEEEEETMT